MRMQKLLTMAPGEMAVRGRQAILKTAERVVRGSRSDEQLLHDLFATLTDAPGDRHGPAALYQRGETDAAMRRLQDDFCSTAALHFFAGATDAQAPVLTGNYLPNTRRDIIRAADAVCAGKFQILGYGRLRFDQIDASASSAPERINWHLDTVSGITSPRLHWSRINALDFTQVGDNKVVWELNRHQWLVQLGLAWQLSGEEKYARVFRDRMLTWMQDNPPGYGINWCSSLEVAYRLMSWCWALALFRHSPVVSPAFHARMSAWIRIHAEHIERYLSTYYSPNTHLTGEALGLCYAAVLFPLVDGATRWRTLGRRTLLQQLSRQVHEDGVYFEQSTRYQHYTLEIYLQFMILAQRSGDPLPALHSRRIQAMLDFMLNVRRPDGTLPQIGDADGGTLFSVVHRAPGDFQGVLAIAAAMFEREDLAWAAGDSTAELISLLGPSGHYRFMALQQKAPPLVESRLYADGGYLVMRDTWRRQGHQLIFDVGPLGCEDSAAHGHADLLSIQCSAFGDNYLVDAGTGNYTAEPFWRNYFRSTAAHNTITVDGRSQMTVQGPFSWQGRRPEVCLRSCWTTPNLSLADASHDAWADQHDPVTHRRRIIFVRRSYWVVVDDLSAISTHEYRLRYQFAAIPVKPEQDGWIRALGDGGSCLLMHVHARQALDIRIVSGQTTPAAGWISENYGQRRPAPMLSVSATAVGPLRFITVLYPQPDEAATPPGLVITSTAAGERPDCLRIAIDPNHHDRIVITDDDISVNQGATVCVE